MSEQGVGEHGVTEHGVTEHIYRLLLAAYPAEFREEYGWQMAQVFRDRSREAQRSGAGAVIGLWLHTLLDVAATAPGEHLDRLSHDLRYGARMLRASPGFTLVAVLTLALGIGANTAMFSVINAVLLRPLPYKDPDRVVWITELLPRFQLDAVPGPDFLEWKDASQVFDHLAAYSAANQTLTGAGDPERIRCGMASAGFFAVLGVAPALGRVFSEQEDRPGANLVALVTHDFWQRRFGGERTILGRALTIDGKDYTVIGILPVDFQFAEPAAVWTPLALDVASERRGERMMLLRVLGCLRPGVTAERAQAELGALVGRLEQATRLRPRGAQARVVPLQEQLVGRVRPSLLILLGAVSLVLLIACANVANLLLARAVARQREMSIRTALGAGRRRLVRQLLTESLLLAVLGGGLGFLLAAWGIRSLTAILPSNVPRLAEISLDLRVLGFTLLVSLAMGVLFGLAPALAASRPPGPSRGQERTMNPLRNLLVASEVALTLVLLIGAGLLLKSFWRLRQTDPGFRPERVLTLAITLNPARYPQRQQQTVFFQRLIDQVRSVPGVEYAGATSTLPLSGGSVPRGIFSFEGESPWPPDDVERHLVQVPVVSPDYFRVMGIPLHKGRFLTEQDAGEAAGAVVITEGLARRFFPGQDPVGKRIKFGLPEAPLPLYTIVGVVGDVRQSGLDTEPASSIYLSYLKSRSAEILRPGGDPFLLQSMHLVVRSAADPLALASAVRSRALAVDKDQPVYDVQTMEQRLANWTAPQRFRTLLLGLFAALALVLAAVGIYGVLSYAVRLRAAEIGIRMALGAHTADILKLVVGQGMAVTLAGVAAGLAAAAALTRLLTGLLYGVTPTDPATFAAVSVFLTAVALAASYFPARRAAKIDPMEALRHE